MKSPKSVVNGVFRRLRPILGRVFLRPVQFNDLLRTEPISRLFGYDRGTPIDRYYIESFLEMNRKVITGTVLEIADSTYSKQFGSEVSKYEVLHYAEGNPNATIVGDLTRVETLPLNSIDCFICTQTLNFTYDVREAVKGSYHMLKDKGVFLCTVAGLSQISRYDMDRWGDYWRFTNLSIQKIFDEIFGPDNVEVTVYGNVLAATAFLQGLAVEDLPDSSLLQKHDADYQITIAVKAVKRMAHSCQP